MTDGEAFEPSVRIVSGLHAGAECLLPRRPFTIGGEPPSDVILFDEGIAPVHVILEAEGDDLRVITRAEGVVIGGTPLGLGETVLAALPVHLLIGTVQVSCESGGIRVADPDASARIVVRSADRLIPRTTAGRLAGAGGLMALVVAVAAIRIAADNTTSAQVAVHGLALSVPRAEHAEASATETEIRPALSAEMKRLGLDELKTDVDSGIVTVRGLVEPSATPRLRTLELWFDQRFGETAVLLSEVRTAPSEPLAVPLQSVWAGPDPNIVLRGRAYREGDTMTDGTVVEKITDRSVLFKRQGQSFELDY